MPKSPSTINWVLISALSQNDCSSVCNKLQCCEKIVNNYTASNEYSMAINAVYMYRQIYTHQQNDKCMDNKYGKKEVMWALLGGGHSPITDFMA